MTTAVPTPTRPVPEPRLRLVGDRPRIAPATPGSGTVGYLVYLPETVDPVALLRTHGVRPEVYPLVARTPPRPAPEPEPAPGAAPDPADGLRIDGTRRTIEVDGRELDLTYLEFELIAHLLTHPHAVHTREALMATIWGYDHIGDGRTVDVHVARLRRKLGPAYRDRIVTIRRVGYKYVPDHR
ncbi:winged helix-turn-helix domain-containing protein [Streptomyces sp. NPDC035033]|uniref:winged helix-turn-helix domain-containing protein n=1 Tax=Streptomyces sp. NPDC035033 TaxID=3155368 RepID=UPI0033D71A78